MFLLLDVCWTWIEHGREADRPPCGREGAASPTGHVRDGLAGGRSPLGSAVGLSEEVSRRQAENYMETWPQDADPASRSSRIDKERLYQWED